MHGEMMPHMMEHMQAGGADAMMKCLMMQMMHNPKCAGRTPTPGVPSAPFPPGVRTEVQNAFRDR